jgi:glutathione S-transferase
MFAAEKDIPLEIIEVDIANGETHGPDYLRINPLGELPTLLRPDGTYLSESLAICRWLEETYPSPCLMGGTPDERSIINSWVDRLMFRLYVPTTHVFRHTHPFWAEKLVQIPAWGDIQRAAVLDEYAALDNRLKNSAYIAGSHFTIADIVAFTTIDFGKPSKLRVSDSLPHLLRWFREIGDRSSARA